MPKFDCQIAVIVPGNHTAVTPCPQQRSPDHKVGNAMLFQSLVHQEKRLIKHIQGMLIGQ